MLRQPWPATALGVHGADGPVPSVPRIRDGALLTGDRARLTDEGVLELLGRADQVFTVAGQLVAAAEVRATLEEHPYVDRAEVLDRPDASTGRAVVAVVQMRVGGDVPRTGAGAERMAADLRAHVRDRLGGLSQPRSVVFVDQLPEAPADELRAALRLLTASTAVVQHLSGQHVAATLELTRTTAGHSAGHEVGPQPASSTPPGTSADGS
ncbi:long-chain fatty acid--CoA ligase [Nitriliruptoraceae bacterium ZYF776]|nr:long-chain fatty acid--CoA ligase [Profundirhabdus halotolerans]